MMDRLFYKNISSFSRKIGLILGCLVFLCTGLWGTDYVYINGGWNTYTGTETTCEGVESDSGNFTSLPGGQSSIDTNNAKIYILDNTTLDSFSPQNSAVVNIKNGVSITLTGTSSIACKVYNDGNLINNGTTTFGSDFNGSGSITNSGNITFSNLVTTVASFKIYNNESAIITFSNSLNNSGYISNNGTINSSSLVNNGTIENTGNLKITSAGIQNNGSITNSGTLTAQTNIENTGTGTIASDGEISAGNGIQNDGSLESTGSIKKSDGSALTPEGSGSFNESERTTAGSFYWVGGATGKWNSANNWKADGSGKKGIPGVVANDIAYIPGAGDVEITIPAGYTANCAAIYTNSTDSSTGNVTININGSLNPNVNIFTNSGDASSGNTILNVNEDITIANLYVKSKNPDTPSSSTAANTTINLAVGKELNITGKVELNSRYDVKAAAVLQIRGSGKVTTSMFDYAYSRRNTGSDHIHILDIASESTFSITDNLIGDSDVAGSMKFTGRGTLYIPASGAYLNWGSQIAPSYENTLTILPVGEPSYYRVEVNGLNVFPENNITLKIYAGTQASADGSTGYDNTKIYYPYEFREIADASGNATYKLGTKTVTQGSKDSDTGGNVLSVTSKNKQETSSEINLSVTYSPGSAMTNGDGFIMDIYTPDKARILTTIEWHSGQLAWTGETNADFGNTNNWVGLTDVNGDGSITVIENLAGKDLVISSSCKNKPEILSTDTKTYSLNSLKIDANASFTISGGTLSVPSITVADTGKRGVFTIEGGTVKTENITLKGSSEMKASGGNIEFSSATPSLSAEVPENMILPGLNIPAGCTLTCPSDLYIAGDFVHEGDFADLPNTTIHFTGTSQNVTASNSVTYPSIIISGGSVTFTNDIKVESLTINSSGTLIAGSTASSQITISECTQWKNNGNFTANQGTVKFADSPAITGTSVTDFYDVIFNGKVTSATSNTYHDVTFKGTTSLSGNNTFNDVVFEDSALLSGKNTFNDFTADNLGGKTLTINSTQTVNGALKLSGTRTSNSNLVITGNGNGSFKLTYNQYGAGYLTVAKTGTGPVITGGTYTSMKSGISPADGTSPSGWKIFDTDLYIWIGGTSGNETDWGTDSNWLGGVVPDGVEVLIPVSVNYPEISSDVKVKSIKFETESKLTIGNGASLTINDDFVLSENFYGEGDLIISSGKTATFDKNTDVNAAIKNNGTVDCGTFNVTFNKAVKNETAGTFKLSSASTTFLNNADFSTGTLDFSGATKGDVNIYNNVTAENQPSTSFIMPAASLTLGNLNFGGNVVITLNAALTCSTLSMKYEAGKFYNNYSFTSQITGTGSLNATKLYYNRVSATDNVYGTLKISADVTVTGTDGIEGHSGTIIQIDAGKTLTSTNFKHEASHNANFYSQINIEGTLDISDTLKYLSSEDSVEITVAAGGMLKAGTITKTSATTAYQNKDKEFVIINNGDIEIDTTLNLPENFKIKNDGTITGNSGATFAFGGSYDTAGTGTLIVDGGRVSNESATITIKNLTLKNENTLTGTKKITVTNAVYDDSTVLTLTGSVTLPGVTKGDVTVGDGSLATQITFTSPFEIDNLTIKNSSTLTPYENSENKINVKITNNASLIEASQSYTITNGTDPYISTIQFEHGATITATNKVFLYNVKFLGNANIETNFEINDFTADSLGGKTITVTGGKIIRVAGDLKLSGNASDTPLTLKSSNTTPWTIHADPEKSTVKWVTLSYSSANQGDAGRKDIHAIESTDGGNNTKWDFSIEYIWTGATGTVWENPSNWTPSFGYPGSTSTLCSVIIPDNVLNKPVYTSANPIKSLVIGTATETTHNASVTLGVNNLTVDDGDSLKNYGKIIFTDSGRIFNNAATPATPVPIMDTERGIVEYATGSGNITDIYPSDSTKADYYDLLISSGSWTLPENAVNETNIKAANSFVNDTSASLTIENTSVISSNLENKGNLIIPADSDSEIWADFENTGSVSIADNGNLSFTKDCTTVSDKGTTWTFAGSGKISFVSDATTDKPVSFESESSTSEYVINTVGKTGNSITFKGKDSSTLMKIASYTDGTDTKKCDFQNVEFLNAVTFNSNNSISGSEGIISFVDNATVNKGEVVLNEIKINCADDASVELKAESISIESSVLPAATDTKSLVLTATAGTIKVGVPAGDDIKVGSADYKFKDITISTANQNINFGEKVTLYAANDITVVGKEVTFENYIVAGNALIVKASDLISVNGLTAKSFTPSDIAGTGYPSKIRNAGTIEITGGNFTIDYPVLLTDDAEYKITDTGAKFILGSTNGTINTDSGIASPANLTVSAAEIDLSGELGNASDGKLGTVNFKNDVVLNGDKTLTCEKLEISEPGVGFTGGKIILTGDFENKVAANTTFAKALTVNGNFTNAGTITLSEGVSVAGNFSDSGSFTGGLSPVGVITLTGNGTTGLKTQTFAAASSTADYTIILNKGDATDNVVEFTNAITLDGSKLDVTTHTYKGKLLFCGSEMQVFKPVAATVYENIEVNNSNTNPSAFIFDGELKAKALALKDGSVKFTGNVTLTDGASPTDANFETTDKIILTKQASIGNALATPLTISAKSITIAGSIIPEDGDVVANRGSFIKLVSSDGDIKIGGDIGASTNYYNTVILNAVSKDIKFFEKIYCSNIDVTCKSVTFENLIYVGGVSIHATDTVSINGLESETLNIDSTAQNIKLGGNIHLTSAADFIIDYPLQIIAGTFYDAGGNSVTSDFDAVFDINGNIIVRNNGINNTTGSINSDGDSPRNVEFKAGSGNRIHIYNGESSGAGLGTTKALGKVQFDSKFSIEENTEIDAEKLITNGTLTIDGGTDKILSVTGNFQNDGTLTVENALSLSGDFINTTGKTAHLKKVVTAGGNLTNDGTATFSSGVTIAGNFLDNGIWTTGTLPVGLITLNGTENTLFTTTKTTAYDLNLQINDTNKTLTFDNAVNINYFKNDFTTYKCSVVFQKDAAISNGINFTCPVTLSPTGTDLTLSGDLTFDTFNITGSVKINGSNTINTLKAENLGGKTIIFQAGTTQTINENLTLKGSASDNLLTLCSSTAGNQWMIECGTDEIEFVNVSDSKNISSQRLNAKGPSVDKGNNSRWNFPGVEYTWTGAGSDSNWFNQNNWISGSVPGIGSFALIPAVENHPVLEKTLENDESEDASIGSTGKITLTEAGSKLDLQNFGFTAEELKTKGRIRLSGTQSVDVDTIINEAGSVVEYYGECSSVPLKDSYAKLEFTDGATGTIAADITVLETTLFANGTANSLELNGNNKFTGLITIGDSSANVDGGKLTINSIALVEISEDAKCDNLVISSSAALLGNVTTTGSQTYNGALTLSKDTTTLTGSTINLGCSTISAGSNNLIINGTANLTENLEINAAAIQFKSTLDGNFNLTVTGKAVFEDEIGETQPLSAIKVTGDAVIFKNLVAASLEIDGITDFAKAPADSGTEKSISTTGTQNYKDQVTVSYDSVKIISGTAADPKSTKFEKNITGTGKKLYISCGSVTIADDVTVTPVLINENDGQIQAAGKITFEDKVENTGRISLGTSTDFKKKVTNSGTIELGSGDSTFADETDNTGGTITCSTGDALFTGKFANTNGTITGNTGKLTFKDEYNGTSAEFTASSSDTSFEKSVDLSGTTFTHNGGNIILTPSGSNLVLSGNSTFNTVQLEGSVNITGSNTFADLTGTLLGGKTITFQAGETQTITGKLTLKGSASDNLLTLCSSTAGNQWIIECGTDEIEFVTVSDSKNISSQRLNATGPSVDNGNNHRWNFPGVEYTWTGASDSNWFNQNNWNSGSVPGVGSYALIPTVVNHPVLEKTLENDESEDASIGSTGRITLTEAGSKLDLQNFGFTAAELNTKGRIRLTGNQTIAVDTIINEDGSVVEYYGECSSVPLKDSYAKLEFTDGATGTITADITVNETTLFANGTANLLKLNGNNKFTGPITIGDSSANVDGGNLTIKSITDVEISDDAKCNSLSLTAEGKNVELKGSFASLGSAYFKALKVKTSGGSAGILKAISADNIEINCDYENSGFVEVSAPLTVTGSLENKETYKSEAQVSVAGDFTDTNGTWISGTQTIVLNGTENQNFNPNALTVYNSIKINKNNGNTEFTDELKAGDVDVDKTVLADFKKKVEISNLSIDTAQKVDFEGEVQISSLRDTVNAGDIYFEKGGVISSDTEFKTPGIVSFNKDSAHNFDFTASNVKHTAGKTVLYGTVTFADGDFGETDCKTNITVNCDSVTLRGNVEKDSAVDYLRVNGSVITNGNIEIAPDLILNGSFGGDGKSVLKENLFVTGSATDINLGTVKVAKDIVIDANRAINTSGTISTDKNFVLYRGDLQAAASSMIFAAQDIILLGSNYDISDSATGIADEYKYQQTRLSPYNYSRSDFNAAAAISDGTALALVSDFAASYTAASGSVLRSGKNFYANGISLSGTSDWYVDIPENADAAVCFAEIYNSNVTNGNVRYFNGTSVAKDEAKSFIPAYNCTITSGSGWDNEDFEIFKAYTVRDDVVCVEFTKPVRNKHGEVNGVSYISSDTNPAEPIISQFKYSAGLYTNIYSDPDCQVEWAGDVTAHYTDSVSGKTYYYLYLKADGSWNTDATGASAGESESTDRNGNHKSAMPFIDIERAVAGKNYIVTDKWGKRLNHYSTANGGTAYGSAADLTHQVEDLTGPVLYKVRTGQELHTIPDGNASTQKAYDAHNFIEFTYSEKVEFFGTGNDSLLNGNPSTQDIQNIAVTSAFAGLKGNIKTAENLNFAGLGIIEHGKLYTGKQGSPDALVNALYRRSPYSLFISAAGLVEGTVMDSTGDVYNNWTGYIEEAEMPSGKVVYPDSLIDDGLRHYVHNVNNSVKDLKGNSQEKYAYDMANKIPEVDSTEIGIYGKWDISSPIFAPLRMKAYENDEYSWSGNLLYELAKVEAIGNTNATGSTLDRIEFHLFDNTPAYDETDEAEWISEVGWIRRHSEGTKEDLYKDFTHSADITGGARQFDSDSGRRTAGGIRYSSIQNAGAGFLYTTDLKNTPNKSFNTTVPGYTGSVATLFTGTSMPRQSATTKEGLYFGIALNELSLPIKTTFKVSYDDSKAFITDLAGNRLRSYEMTTIDRTPPSFYLTLSPINQNELQVTFVKSLSRTPEFMKTAGNVDIVAERDFNNLLAGCFDFVEIDDDGNPTVQNDLFVTSAAFISNQNPDQFTSLSLRLNRNVTLKDVEKLSIRLIVPDEYNLNGNYTSYDLLTAQPNARVSLIQDNLRNYLEVYSAHALSDFLIGAVNPRYAYDPDMTAADGSYIMQNLYDNEGSWAVHDWSRDQGNYGTLPYARNVLMFSDVNDGTEEKLSLPENIRIYLSSNPPADTLSNQINYDLKTDYRIWLPNETVDVFATIADKNNKNYVAKEAVPADSEDKSKGIMVELESSFIENNFKAGDQVSFLFGILDSAGMPVKIFHAPEIDVDRDGKYLPSSTKFPLYAVRLTNDSDISSIDLWSFRLKSNVAQRGGVTILNNVINVTDGEKTVVKLDNPDAGKVSIIVMTLDGNVVTYLNRGNVTKGEHYYTWDGKNDSGKTVARGMYFVRVIGNGIDETRKVMVVK